MQKQQLALKSLKILLCFQSWSNFPAKSLWPEVRTAVSMPFVDLIQDRILCIIEKMGIVVEAEGASSRLWFVSWVKEKLRHKAPLLLSISCVLHVVSYQQMFQHKHLLALTGFAVLYLSALALFDMGWFTAVALLHIHTCVVHMKRSLLKGENLKICFENLWG